MTRNVKSLCCTSVQDTQSTLYHVDNMQLLKDAIRYELENGNRTTMIRILKAKIRELEAKQKGQTR